MGAPPFSLPINMIYGALIFPETLPPERRRAFDWRRANPLGAWQAMRALPGMGGVALVLLLWQVASLVYPMTCDRKSVVSGKSGSVRVALGGSRIIKKKKKKEQQRPKKN